MSFVPVLFINAHDPSGCAGLGSDLATCKALGGHGLGVATGIWVADSAEVFALHTLDPDVVSDQAQAVLEDSTIGFWKMSQLGDPDNVAMFAEWLSDYQARVVCYAGGLQDPDESEREDYLKDWREKLLPQVWLLVGSLCTLSQLLLPDHNKVSAEDLAREALRLGVTRLAVTGDVVQGVFHNHLFENGLKLARVDQPCIEGSFAATGEVFSAAMTTMLAAEIPLADAFIHALGYTFECLNHAYQPGMGQMAPNHLYMLHGFVSEESSPPESNPATEADPTRTSETTAHSATPVSKAVDTRTVGATDEAAECERPGKLSGCADNPTVQ